MNKSRRLLIRQGLFSIGISTHYLEKLSIFKNNDLDQINSNHNIESFQLSKATESMSDVVVINSISELSKIKKNVNFFFILGYYSPGDGGDGFFCWSPDSSEKSNLGTIFNPYNISKGRWKRIFSGAVNVKWYGAKGDGIKDDSEALQNALMNHENIFIPKGTYIVSRTLEIKFNGSKITGEGKILTILKWKGKNASNSLMLNASKSYLVLSDFKIEGTGNSGSWDLENGILLASESNIETSGTYQNIVSRISLVGINKVAISCGVGGAKKVANDCKFYDIEISYSTVGIYSENPNISLFSPIIYQCQTGIFANDNTKMSVVGGVLSKNKFDIYLRNAGIAFYATYFENSFSGIINIPEKITSKGLCFSSCHLHTLNSNDLMDFKNNLRGSLEITNCWVYPESASKSIKLGKKIKNLFIEGNDRNIIFIN